MAMAAPVTNMADTLVTLKVNIDGTNRRFKLPLRDLGANTLPEKLRLNLGIPSTTDVVFERYSDSAASFVVLDPNNPSVYKQLYRAAKAKLKLRLRVTVKDSSPMVPHPATVEDEMEPVVPAIKQEAQVLPIRAVSMSNLEARLDTPSTTTVSSTEESKHSVATMSSTTSHTIFTGASPPPSRENVAAVSAVTSRIPLRCPAARCSEVSGAPRHSMPRDMWFADVVATAKARREGLRARLPQLPASSIFNVYCNNCNDAIPDAHYHCSTCDHGDYDLCQSCVTAGAVCNGDNHWLIKRYVKNGQVFNSVTQTIPPKPRANTQSKEAIAAHAKESEEDELNTRTCNSCLAELTEEHFITCVQCSDYDVCMTCHMDNLHGHDPRHPFMPAVDGTHLSPIAKSLLPPGRNMSHNAICDGCDKHIYGVRHKCLDCPDWDFCATCFPYANAVHPQHRFVPIYEALGDLAGLARVLHSKPRHHGIYCDGPLCNNDGRQSYIRGDRFKCAVCHDTDFCASCESNPTNPHNKTHPMIKFKTPVRNCNVTTFGDHEDGKPLPVMGDRSCRTQSKATETTASTTTNAATQVQTVVDMQPTEKIEVPTESTIKQESFTKAKSEVQKQDAEKPELIAYFVRDAIPDGTVFGPNHVFEQTWYMRNGGTTAWPAGCSVKFVGGDNMCAVDPEHPASVHELVSAAESTTCYTEVAAGAEASFTVLMRTPNRVGNFISYWRLTGPSGEKFGHRLWCDVTVNEQEEASKSEPEIKTESSVEPESSQMIFPKLEVESPHTSMHQEVASSVSESKAVEEDFEDFVEQSLDDDETEDGFLTDEEYDILDASDEEYLAAQAKGALK